MVFVRRLWFTLDGNRPAFVDVTRSAVRRRRSIRRPRPRMPSRADDPDRPAGPRRLPLRGAACAWPAPRRWLLHAVELPGSRPTRAHRGVAPAGARPGARRPDPDLEPVQPGTTGRLLRRDARPAGHRPARPADVGGCREDDRAGIRRPPHGPGHRPGCRRSRRSRPRRLPDDHCRGPVGRTRRGRPALPARLGGPPGGLEAARAQRRVPAHLHQWHDRDAEGRDADPRQRGSLDRVVPPHRAADGAPAGVAPAAVALARAGRRAVLRARCRRAHPLRPEPEPAGHLRFAARASGHLDGAGAPGARPLLERDRTRDRQARPPRDGRPTARRRSPSALCSSAPAVPQHPRASSGATSGCFCPRARSCRRPCSRRGRTWA